MWLLVEPELDGRFTKWNNNAGAVLRGSEPPLTSVRGGGTSRASALGLGAIVEDSDEEDEDGAPIEVEEVPQAFSHFSYVASHGKQLVCDLQGVWNATDGFVLTDPVIHYVSSKGSRRHKNGGTDKGAQGVLSFFKTHKCGEMCQRLGLPPPDMAALMSAANEEARMCVVCMDAPRAARSVVRAIIHPQASRNGHRVAAERKRGERRQAVCGESVARGPAEDAPWRHP